jgi:hypothetical protein
LRSAGLTWGIGAARYVISYETPITRHPHPSKKLARRPLRVEIFRLPGRTRWSLAVLSDDSPSIVWSTDFATDHEAYAEFCRRLEKEGIPSLLEQ